jgi:LPXTG-motif cell wall-anchored protein
MEKKFKRVLVLFLALLMLFGLLPAVSAPALADTTIITDVAITGVTAPAVGEFPTILGIGTSTEGVTVNLDPNNTNWGAYLGGSTPYFWSFDKKFEAGKEYCIDIMISSAEGYSFADPSAMNVNVTVNGNPAKKTEIEACGIGLANRRIRLQFAALPGEVEKCTVSFNPGEGGSGTMADVKVEKHLFYELPNADGFTPPEGKHFLGWEVGGEQKSAGDKIQVNSDITLTALWGVWKDIDRVDITGVTPPKAGELPTVEGIGITTEGVKFLLNPTCRWLDSSLNVINEPFEAGKTYYLRTCFNADFGYRFKDPSEMTAYMKTTEENTEAATKIEAHYGINRMVYFKFPAFLNVSLNPDNGGIDPPTVTAVEEGGEYTLPACAFTAPVGKKFKSWELEGVEQPEGHKFTVTKDTEVKALWEPLKFTVTYKDEADAVIGAPQIVIYGNDAVPEAFPDKAGFTGKWDHDGKNITEDKIIKPVYVELKMTKEPPAWTQGSGKDAEFASNAEFSDFVGVKVDDKDLDPANYDVKEGSIIVTLKAAYLKTLAPGKHKVEILSKTGSSVGHITIKAATAFYAPSPKTGDSNDVFFWLEIALLSAAGLVLTYFEKKRRKNNF